ncbi:MAG: chitobiase/beta-hexosaminidase C-terminal domain-containing protein, partial [Methanobacteriaceae archaeon]|nr:chitobiase/beta-hexosaminidase C-terminal domain-containing protein [Methanobacteriaceae archaeon]
KVKENKSSLMKFKLFILLFLALILIFSVDSVSAAGNTIYVNDTGGNDDNDGSDWNTAKKTIKNATGSVNVNGIVNIANGQYNGTSNTQITIDKNMTINGESQTGTIINGTGTNWIFHVNPGITFKLNNLTITNANRDYGAGIYNSGNFTVSGSTISGNTASSGGGIYNYGGIVVVSGSTISGNTATYNGGGIYNCFDTDWGNVTVSGSTISGNTALEGGGGIYNYVCYVTVSGSTISGNTANAGGGIYNYDGILTVSGSSICGNTANAGGGIYKYYGTSSVSGSSICGNTANAGGGIYSYIAILNANFNRIVDNSPTAIQNNDGTVNARYNWWGSNNPDFTTLISGVVDYNLWLYMTLQANPNTILQGESSNLTVSFNNAFDGTTVTHLNPVDGNIPDKTPVTFNTDLGSVGSKTINKETMDGIATATLTADETAGIAHVNAVTDSQTVNADVTINQIISSTITTTENKKNIPGQKVELKAIVKDDEGNNVNEGQVRFTVNGIIVDPVYVVNGQAVLNWTIPSNWAAGNKIILAEFLGTDNYLTSQSNATLTVDTPPTAKASIKGGLYNVNKNVSLSMNKPGVIYYTRNGSTPTTVSTKYTDPLSISSTTTLKFIAVDLEGNVSPVYTEKYVIDKTAPKVVSTYPKNLSTGQSRTATLYLKFSENLKASTYWSKIYVKDLKTGKKVSITKYIKGNILYIKTKYKRASLRSYQVYVPYKAVKDYAGNNLVKTFAYKFKTRR